MAVVFRNDSCTQVTDAVTIVIRQKSVPPSLVFALNAPHYSIQTAYKKRGYKYIVKPSLVPALNTLCYSIQMACKKGRYKYMVMQLTALSLPVAPLAALLLADHSSRGELGQSPLTNFSHHFADAVNAGRLGSVIDTAPRILGL